MMRSVALLAIMPASLVTATRPAEAQRRMASLDAQLGVTTNPFTSAADIEAGEGNFQARCASCHGADGTGSR